MRPRLYRLSVAALLLLSLTRGAHASTIFFTNIDAFMDLATRNLLVTRDHFVTDPSCSAVLCLGQYDGVLNLAFSDLNPGNPFNGSYSWTRTPWTLALFSLGGPYFSPLSPFSAFGFDVSAPV